MELFFFPDTSGRFERKKLRRETPGRFQIGHGAFKTCRDLLEYLQRFRGVFKYSRAIIELLEHLHGFLGVSEYSRAIRERLEAFKIL